MPDSAAALLMVGCGDLGARIARTLAGQGREVWTLTRSGGGPWPALRGDVSDPATLPELAGRFETVVHCLSPRARDEPAYRSVYLDGLRHVIAAVAVDVVPRICFVSSTAVYGDAGGAWVDEDAPCQPEGFNGRILREAESLCLSTGTANLVFRLGGIYGPGRESLIQKARAGATATAEAAVWGNRIHVDDAAAAIAHLIAGRQRGIFNVVDPSPAPASEVTAWIAGQLGLPGVAPDLGRMPAGGRRVSCQRLAGTGFHWRYPDYRSGYAALLRR